MVFDSRAYTLSEFATQPAQFFLLGRGENTHLAQDRVNMAWKNSRDQFSTRVREMDDVNSSIFCLCLAPHQATLF